MTAFHSSTPVMLQLLLWCSICAIRHVVFHQTVFRSRWIEPTSKQAMKVSLRLRLGFVRSFLSSEWGQLIHSVVRDNKNFQMRLNRSVPSENIEQLCRWVDLVKWWQCSSNFDKKSLLLISHQKPSCESGPWSINYHSAFLYEKHWFL